MISSSDQNRAMLAIKEIIHFLLVYVAEFTADKAEVNANQAEGEKKSFQL